jgi:ATP synthase proteolipid subunit
MLSLTLLFFSIEAINQWTFFGYMGLASALVFANLGAAYGTAKSGVGICVISVLRYDLMFKSLIPGIMAGILGIYGLIVAVIYQGKSKFFPAIRRMARLHIYKPIHIIITITSIGEVLIRYWRKAVTSLHLMHTDFVFARDAYL